MKSYDEAEKMYADMVADGKVAEKIKTLLKEKRASVERAQKEQLYGYKMVDGNQLAVDEIPAENVVFIFRKVVEYGQNPPDELVVRLMEEYKHKGTNLTFEEAKPLVNLSTIQEYVAEELSIKNMAFALSDSPPSVETLRAILARPFADFPAADIRRAYRDKMQTADSNPTWTWLKRVRRVSCNSIYTGTLTLEQRPSSPSVRKQCALERVEFSDHHKALVSKEQFEQVKRVLKEAKRDNSPLEI